MPRSSSSSVRYTNSSAYSRPTRSSTSVPTITPSSPPVQQHKIEVERPGFFSNMWTGFGLGAGQSIAFNMFRKDPEPVVVKKEDTSLEDSLPKEYVQCVKIFKGDTEKCKELLQ